MDEFRKKLFEYGIYGCSVTKLSAEELKLALKAPYAEIVTQEVALALANAFNMKKHITVTNSNEITTDHVVRMATSAWKDYIFGPSVNITSRPYFHLINYLLQHSDFVDTATVRRDLQIDPKTLFYITKKLKSLDILEDYKQALQTYIKLRPLQDKSTEENLRTEEVDIYGEDPVLRPENLKLYHNCPLLDQVYHTISNASEGIDAKSLHMQTGLVPKVGYKILQRLATLPDSDLCMVPEICHKSVVHRWFTNALYERITLARIKQISGSTPVDIRKSISTVEKETAMRLIAKKYKRFILNHSIVDEISTMTGWAYTFDKKTLLKTARAIGLYITKPDHTRAGHYILSIDPVGNDAEVIIKKKKHDHAHKGVQRLKHQLIWSVHFTRLDNGQATNLWQCCRKLLLFINSELEQIGSDSIQFVELYHKMPMQLFYEISGATKACFRCHAAYNVWYNNKDRFLLQVGDTDAHKEIFYKSNGIELIRPVVFTIADAVDQLIVSEFLLLAPKQYAETVQTYIQSRYIAPALNSLGKKKYIAIEEVDGVRIVRRGAEPFSDEEMERRIRKSANRTPVNYNLRMRIAQSTIKIEEDDYQTAFKQMLFKDYPQPVASEIWKTLYSVKPIRLDLTKDVIPIPEAMQPFYLIVKGIVVRGIERPWSLLEKYPDADLEFVVQHLLRRKIIAARVVNRDCTAIPVSSKFLHLFSIKPDFIRQHCDVVDNYLGTYFCRIFKYIKEKGSVDTAAILQKMHYIEDFELDAFLKVYESVFRTDKIDTFTTVTLKNIEDPFLGDL